MWTYSMIYERAKVTFNLVLSIEDVWVISLSRGEKITTRLSLKYANFFFFFGNMPSFFQNDVDLLHDR